MSILELWCQIQIAFIKEALLKKSAQTAFSNNDQHKFRDLVSNLRSLFLELYQN